MSTLIIAEAGVNHNGNLNMALELIKVAKESGADAIKFQTFTAKNLVTKDAKKAEYQIINTQDHVENQFQMLQKLELSFSDYQIIKQSCDQLNIEFISTPFDLESVQFLNQLPVHRFKIGSGDLTNYQLLKAVALTQKPIILSTGMSDLSEVHAAVQQLKKYTLQPITLLHCVSSYPTPFDQCNLTAIQTLNRQIGLPTGFSDHTLGNQAAVIAVSLGAVCLEKHFTLDKNLPGPDHQASLDPRELKEYVEQVRQTEVMLGDGIKRCLPCESNTRELVRRSVMINEFGLKAGQVLSESDLICLRPDTGISAIHFEELIGRRLKHDLSAYAQLQWTDLENI